MDGEFVELAIKIVVVVAVAGAAAWQAHRFRQAAAEPIPEGQCVACDSTEVQTIASGVYRCTACGYEGGPGVAAREAGARREAMASMSQGERRDRARACLQEALGMLQRADENPLSHDAEDRLSWLGDLEGALVHAQGQIARAMEYAQGSFVQTDRGRFDAAMWSARLETDGPRASLRDVMGVERKVAARMKAARLLRDELRRALLEAVGQG